MGRRNQVAAARKAARSWSQGHSLHVTMASPINRQREEAVRLTPQVAPSHGPYTAPTSLLPTQTPLAQQVLSWMLLSRQARWMAMQLEEAMMVMAQVRLTRAQRLLSWSRRALMVAPTAPTLYCTTARPPPAPTTGRAAPCACWTWLVVRGRPRRLWRHGGCPGGGICPPG